MIEKLEKQNTWGECLEKLNEVIDAVNELQLAKDVMFNRIDRLNDAMCDMRNATKNVQPDAESRPENVQDVYAKYRGWAGKLCRFWNEDKDRAIYDILEEVIANWYYQFRAKSDYVFDHCEPVKPDDDIIYKGGDNE